MSGLGARHGPPLAPDDLADRTNRSSGPVAVEASRRLHRLGPHRHPVPVVGVVTAGGFVVEGRPARTVRAGDPSCEPARILRFDNASASEPAEILAFYPTDRPEAPLIERLDGESGANAPIPPPQAAPKRP